MLYLFSALAPEQNAQPAGSFYLYAQNEKGKLTIKRNGFCVDEPQIIEAWEREPKTYTNGLKRQTMEEVHELEESMKQAVINAAERILAGEAQKTPSEDACKFCPVRTACDQAYDE